MTPRWPILEALLLVVVWGLLLCYLPGCGGSDEAQPTTGSEKPDKSAPAGKAPNKDEPAQVESSETGSNEPRREPTALPDTLGANDEDASPLPVLKSIPINDKLVASQGIRRIESQHLTLFTDLPPGDQVDSLPGYFDQAYPQWCAYFEIDPQQHADWRMQGFLMLDKRRFDAAGLLPVDLPDFENGFSRGADLWLYEQPSDYYRRHLLLHEGTHGFMNAMLGGCGAGWYMEGTAELLATHRLEDGRLVLRHFPNSREETPMLGRIKLVQQEVREGRSKLIGEVMAVDNRYALPNQTYAWCWALAAFLDGHPQYRQRFRQLKQWAGEPYNSFNRRMRNLFPDQWFHLSEQWQLFAETLDYGHDIEGHAIDFRWGALLEKGERQVNVRSDLGWQNTGVRLKAVNEYVVTAKGRFQLDDEPKIWWSEPDGVTIRYHAGQPLGSLLGVIRYDQPVTSGKTAFLRHFRVGSSCVLQPLTNGTLYLQLNDGAGDRGDNIGGVSVSITARRPEPS